MDYPALTSSRNWSLEQINAPFGAVSLFFRRAFSFLSFYFSSKTCFCFPLFSFKQLVADAIKNTSK